MSHAVGMYCGYTVRRREKVAIISLYDVVYRPMRNRMDGTNE